MPRKSAPPSIRQLPAAKQRRLDELLDKNREGTITSKEREKLEQLVAEAEELMIANAKRLLEFSQSEGSPAPDAIPVTVWVQSARAVP